MQRLAREKWAHNWGRFPSSTESEPCLVHYGAAYFDSAGCATEFAALLSRCKIHFGRRLA
ncbi:MAG: hypothetical protein EBS01_02335 [Verrucomicrobia bacterium]|nr:hypothetical protein [Verrucomicrobiota bacterium]